jgi:hypothetical protein
LELGDASDLALIGHRFDQDVALGYKGYRLEFRSYLNQDSRRWVPKVFITRLTGPDSMEDAYGLFTAGIGEHAAPVRARVCEDRGWAFASIRPPISRVGRESAPPTIPYRYG